MNTPDDPIRRRAAAITTLWAAIVPIPAFAGGLAILLYQGIVSDNANYTACGAALIAMGFGVGGFFDARSSGKKES